MTIFYYLFQHLVLATGLALLALRTPYLFRLSILPRIFLAISITPQILGLTIMGLALTGPLPRALFIHSPIILGAILIFIFRPRSSQKSSLIHWLKSLPRLPTIASGVLLSVLAIKLISLIASNVITFNPLAHDFNVYMAGAKSFAANPSWINIPSFWGNVGDVIVVHPHSFIYEAYLSHAVMLTDTDVTFPPLDMLARLAEQLTPLYMFTAIIGLAISMGGRWSVAIAIAATLCVPMVDYIFGSLSRDGFRMGPFFGLLAVTSTLLLNFRSRMVWRGVTVGLFSALTILSHTLGGILVALLGSLLGVVIYARRRPSFYRIILFFTPVTILLVPSLLRYADNYLLTGDYMGYGLQYSIYKGTWLEATLGSSWTTNSITALSALKELFTRYGMVEHLGALLVGLATAWYCRKAKGASAYLTVLIAFVGPLIITMFGVLNNFGLNLRNAFLANERYPLSLFLLTPLLLTVGIEKIIKNFGIKQNIYHLLIALSATFVIIAHGRPLKHGWRSYKAVPDDIAQLQLIKTVTDCLKPGENWLSTDDLWNTYFINRQPAFIFTKPLQPLLQASTSEAVNAVLDSFSIRAIAFLYKPLMWRESNLQKALEENHWVQVKMAPIRDREIWLAPELFACVTGRIQKLKP